MLWPAPALEVMIAGGAIRRADGGIVGSSAEEFIDNFKLDYAIIGCSAIDSDGDFFDFDLRDIWHYLVFFHPEINYSRG